MLGTEVLFFEVLGSECVNCIIPWTLYHTGSTGPRLFKENKIFLIICLLS